LGFSSENGYTPLTIDQMMESLRVNINAQFLTEYTTETFIGTNFYKNAYALMQLLQENEVKTSEIFLYLQQYIVATNQRIQRPVATNPGLIEALEAAGYTASVKQIESADAGKLYVCVDVDDTDDDYPTQKLEINTIIKDSAVAGVVSQGTESSTIVLSNGQSFDFKFALPTKTPIALRLTIVTSENNQNVILSPEEIKQLLLDNIAASYKLGRNFEPQKYFTPADAPWAASILLEWADDFDPGPATWVDDIFEAEFDDLLTISLENITLVES
jgi:hypothetical protein